MIISLKLSVIENKEKNRRKFLVLCPYSSNGGHFKKVGSWWAK